MAKVSPTIEEVEDLRRTAPAGPIVMINLLKFKPNGGEAIYGDYMKASGPGAQKAGVELIYGGKAGKDIGGGDEWDLVLIARYPSFGHFADFVTHDDYQKIAVPLRAQALEKALFMVSEPADWRRGLPK